ncbi:hypothetical protein BHM03_00055425 [Ensete ventricosum]|nr:hypothetical protein BHM03_00055425 [Ensete ventricosum]
MFIPSYVSFQSSRFPAPSSLRFHALFRCACSNYRSFLRFAGWYFAVQWLMATAKVEGVEQKKSILSAQRKNNNANGRDTIRVYYQRFLLPTIPEKPTPNYLKPTISSCHGTSSQQPKISSSGAKRGTQMNVSQSPSSLPQRPPAVIRPKERAAILGQSTTANMARKRSLAKASKTPAGGKALPLVKTARILPKVMSSTAAAVKPQGEKLMAVVRGNEARDLAKSLEGEQYSRGSEPKAENVDEQKAGSQRDEAEGRGSKREGDGADKAAQETMESKRQAAVSWRKETADKLAARRSKVKALAGAFETVISLQKPEGRWSQQESVTAAESTSSGSGSGSGAARPGGDQTARNEDVPEECTCTARRIVAADPHSRGTLRARGQGVAGGGGVSFLVAPPLFRNRKLPVCDWVECWGPRESDDRVVVGSEEESRLRDIKRETEKAKTDPHSGRRRS